DGGRSRRGHAPLRDRRRPLRAEGAPPPCRDIRPVRVQGAHRGLPQRVPGESVVLKAYSRVLEQLTLAGDLVIVVGCWLAASGVRFYVAGPPTPQHDIPPLGPYLVMILPTVVVSGISFPPSRLYP